MDDLISRQAAIDAAIEAVDSWDGGCNIGRQKRIENYINSLPPVLGTNLAEVGADLISRQAAMDALNHELRCGAVINQCGLEMAYEIIEDLPSANNSEIPNSQDVTNRQAVKGFPIDADLLMLKVAEEYGCMAYDRLYGIIRNMPKYELPPVLGTNLAEVGTDCISRQAAIDALDSEITITGRTNAAVVMGYCKLVKDRLERLPSAQPERTCVNCGRTMNNGGWYADGRTRCPIEEHYALPKDGYCHLWEKRNVTDDDYPERRTDERFNQQTGCD